MEISSVNSFFNHNITLLLLALGFDYILGDPAYRFHPVRLMGNLLTTTEKWLFKNGLNTRMGGVFLFAVLTCVCFTVYGSALHLAGTLNPFFKWAVEIIVVFHLVALKDLLKHSERIAKATEAGNLELARHEASMLVGRDKDKLDHKACNRSAVESVSESLVDGVISPLFFLLLSGVYGMLLFKIVSTMDSMVGYKNEKYLKFGWFGARADDVMNWIPARLTWMLMTLTSFILPGFSGRGCFWVGLDQHGMVPGPNAGWSECGAAGSLEIKIAGPIFKDGIMVNELWLGDAGYPEGAASEDVYKANLLVTFTAAVFAILAIMGAVFINYIIL